MTANLDRPAAIALRALGLAKRFGDVVALDRIDLEVRDGEFLGVLGPSGCGKTTLLRLVAGFEQPDAGEVEIRGRLVAGPRRHEPPERRRVGMMFQESALFPHLDVAGNIGFGVARPRRATRVAELVALTGLAGLERRLPHELSGGQQQRVALARALAPDPALVLLDEPFNGLDATLRSHLRVEVRDILRTAGATAVFVTHDQAEALEISDRVAIMRAGRFEQVSPPDEVYLRPSNRFVAGFVGEANFLPGDVHGGAVSTLAGTFPTRDAGLAEGDRAEVLLRPEQLQMLRLGDLQERPPSELVLRVVRRVFHGAEVHHVLRGSTGVELEAATPSSASVDVGTNVILRARAREAPVYRVEGSAVGSEHGPADAEGA